MGFDLRHLEVFCKVVETGSFTRAGHMVHLAQASVSERIAALEDAVGTRLLDRLGRRATPTRAGKLLYRRSVEMLELRTRTVAELDELLGLRRGPIDVGASTIPGEFILPAVIGRFGMRYSEVVVQLTIRASADVSRGVSSGELELGVVGSRSPGSELRFDELWTDELVLVAPTSHRWGSGQTVTFDEVCREPFLLREEGSGTRRILEQHLQKDGAADLGSLKVAAVLGSTTAVKEAIRGGFGISILSSRAIQAEIAEYVYL